MQYKEKIRRMMVFLVLFGIVMSGVIVVILSHNAFAQFEQTLHDRRLSEVVNQTSSSQQNSQIDVGDRPSGIGVSEDKNTIYVVKPDSNIVSVISGENNTGIKDIEVGNQPVDIAVNRNTEIAYVTNSESNSVSVIDLGNNTKIGPDIPVGNSPTDIAVYEDTDTVYVLNSNSNSISVINEPVINQTTKQPLTIPVGEDPSAIDVTPGSLLYVADALNNSISVIDTWTFEPVINETTMQPITIPVGARPVAIVHYSDGGGSDDFTSTAYVANLGSDSVSVINATANEPVINQTTKQPLTIPVGDEPIDIAVNELTNTAYVANLGSEGISVIDAETNELMTGVTFHVEPFNSGYIVCDDGTTNDDANTNDTNDLTSPPLAPVEQYFYVSSGTQCTAKSYEGYEFLSWEQNLEDDSTQLIKVSAPASPLDSFLQFLHLKSADKPEAKLMTEFGTFTANFMKAPAPLPPEYLIPLYGIIISTIVGWSIPSIISWAKSKRDVSKLDFYHKEIDRLDDDGKLDENDIGALDRLRKKIVDAYSEGKLNEKHYESLRGEISELYEEIFRKKIAAIDNSSNSNNPVDKKPFQEQLAQVRSEVELAFSKGKINEKHYDLLKNAIPKLDGKEGNNNTH